MRLVVLGAVVGVDGRPSGKLGRDFDERLVDEHRDRIEVAGVSLEAEALGLERQGHFDELALIAHADSVLK